MGGGQRYRNEKGFRQHRRVNAIEVSELWTTTQALMFIYLYIYTGRHIHAAFVHVTESSVWHVTEISLGGTHEGVP